jgi:hypothetical protein
MNKLLIAIALCTALVACKKDDAAQASAEAVEAAATATAAAEDARDAAVEAVSDAVDATEAAVEEAAASASLPQACDDYIQRAQACFDKSAGNVAMAAIKQSFDSVRAEWDKVPNKEVLGDACKLANDNFAQTAAMLKCE